MAVNTREITKNIPFYKEFHKLAPETSQKVLVILFVISWAVSFIYYTPDETRVLLDAFGLYNIQAAYDMPSIFPILGFIWIIIGLVDAAYIHLKVTSDVAIAEGMDSGESCVGGKLHESGEWGWLRVSGTKAFPLEGSKVWVNLLTHIHRIGTHIVFEGHMIPDTTLDYLPFEVKRDIRQRREGLFGIKTCSVGYLSSKELMTHKEFDTDKYKDYLIDEEKVKTPKINTQEFIMGIAISNKTVDMGLQLIENEHDALTRSLKTVKEVGNAVRNDKDKGILQHIFG